MGFFSFASAQDNSEVHPKTSQSKPKGCKLIFGWDIVKPYQYIGASGEVEGFQIELIKSIVKEFNCQVEFRQLVWHELIEKIRNGEIHFMADTTVTEERAQFGYFSDSYRQETFSMYVRKEMYELYHDMSLQQMLESGFRLGMTSGYIYNDEIEMLRKDQRYSTNFIYVDSNIENYRAMVENKIDGFMEDSLIAGYELRNLKMGNYAVALPKEVFRADISFMFSKKSVPKDIVEAFNSALSQVKQTEAFQQPWLIGINN